MGKKRAERAERGDTLVEVTVAMAVLGLMLAASLAVINRGLMGVSNAVERTSVRASLSSQAELLRYVFDDPVANEETYKKILKRTPPTQPNGKLGQNGCKIGGGGFYLSVSKASASKASVAPVEMHELSSTDTDHLVDNVYGQPEAASDKSGNGNIVSRGIWIEGDKHDGQKDGMPGYIDFYVRACWTPHAAQQPGSGRMESNVRVYYKN